MYENTNDQNNNPLGQPQPEVQNTQFQNTNPNPATPPKTWLVESILVTILCCLPLGIVGIINATKVESKFYAGDIEGSLRASEDAKKWTKIGLICGLVVVAIYVVLLIFGVTSGIMAGMTN